MIDRVIIGIDFSDDSRAALLQAVLWARKLGVPLTAMHVLQLPPLFCPEGSPAALDSVNAKDVEEHALLHLRKWIASDIIADPKVAWGNPAESLVQAADPSTLLVIGQAGHSKLQHLLFGSTAARVVRMAPCDVLVVRRGKAIAA